MPVTASHLSQHVVYLSIFSPVVETCRRRHFWTWMHKTAFICWMTAYIHSNLVKSDRGAKCDFIWSSPHNVFTVEFHRAAHIFLLTNAGCIMVWCQKMSYTLVSFLMDVCSSCCNFFYNVIFMLRVHYKPQLSVMGEPFFFEQGGVVWWIKRTEAMTFYHFSATEVIAWNRSFSLIVMCSVVTCSERLGDKQESSGLFCALSLIYLFTLRCLVEEGIKFLQ